MTLDTSRRTRRVPSGTWHLAWLKRQTHRRVSVMRCNAVSKRGAARFTARAARYKSPSIDGDSSTSGKMPVPDHAAQQLSSCVARNSSAVRSGAATHAYN
jgi:hypothetical protein